MSQQNKTQLQSSINSQLADNNSGDISAADVRNNLINMTDSLLFNSGSQSFTGSLNIKGDNVSSNIRIVSASFTYGNLDEAVSIRTSSSINIPSFLLGTSGTKTLVISSYNGNDASLYTTDLTSLSLDCDNGDVDLQPNTLGNTISHGNFLVINDSSLIVTGSLSVTGSVVSLKGLPTSEPSVSGQLWLSGSAGSNSKVLCVRN
jgi:hypothetical protein